MADCRFPRRWSLLLALSGASACVSAAEWLSGDQLSRYCEAFLEESEGEEEDGQLCLSFVQGYLAGAEAIRELTVDHGRTLRSSIEEDESFRERAARTRVGSRLERHVLLVDRPRYCLPEDVGARSVIEQVTEHLRAQESGADPTAARAVHRALVRHFPCDDDGG